MVAEIPAAGTIATIHFKASKAELFFSVVEAFAIITSYLYLFIAVMAGQEGLEPQPRFWRPMLYQLSHWPSTCKMNHFPSDSVAEIFSYLRCVREQAPFITILS